MTDPETGRISQTDRWVLVTATIVVLALIGASVVRGDTTYLPYMSGPATLVALYFIFFR
jgi:hypothetical protein